MGSASDNCPCLKKEPKGNTQIVNEKADAKNKISAYNSMIELFNTINNTKRHLTMEIFLISSKSIKNFINCIIQSHILDYLNTQNKKNLNQLEEQFCNCNEEDNFEIYDDYRKCKTITEKKEENENEFIIVNKNFFINMGKEPYIAGKNEVNLKIDKTEKEEKNKMKIFLMMIIIFVLNKKIQYFLNLFI